MGFPPWGLSPSIKMVWRTIRLCCCCIEFHLCSIFSCRYSLCKVFLSCCLFIDLRAWALTVFLVDDLPSHPSLLYSHCYPCLHAHTLALLLLLREIRCAYLLLFVLGLSLPFIFVVPFPSLGRFLFPFMCLRLLLLLLPTDWLSLSLSHTQTYSLCVRLLPLLCTCVPLVSSTHLLPLSIHACCFLNWILLAACSSLLLPLCCASLLVLFGWTCLLLLSPLLLSPCP